MTTKADDVLQLSTARTLLGCASGQSLVDGVRDVLAQVRALKHHLEAALADASALRDLLIEEQKLRHDYGTRLARIEAGHDTEHRSV